MRSRANLLIFRSSSTHGAVVCIPEVSPHTVISTREHAESRHVSVLARCFLVRSTCTGVAKFRGSRAVSYRSVASAVASQKVLSDSGNFRKVYRSYGFWHYDTTVYYGGSNSIRSELAAASFCNGRRRRSTYCRAQSGACKFARGFHRKGRGEGAQGEIPYGEIRIASDVPYPEKARGRDVAVRRAGKIIRIRKREWEESRSGNRHRRAPRHGQRRPQTKISARIARRHKEATARREQVH